LYPNPAHESVQLSIFSENDSQISYTISDAAGRQIMEEKNVDLAKGLNTLRIGLAGFQLSKGLYFISLTGNGSTVIKKLLIE
jgi:hypothetical protein